MYCSYNLKNFILDAVSFGLLFFAKLNFECLIVFELHSSKLLEFSFRMFIRFLFWFIIFVLDLRILNCF